MSNKLSLDEIKKMEEAGINVADVKKMVDSGIDVFVSDNSGKIIYSTRELGGSEFCDKCSAFRLLPDPDPYDWFRDGDMKAVCTEVDGVIEGSLERPSEWTHICKPIYCPKLGRELTEEEKVKAAEQLKRAKERMNK